MNKVGPGIPRLTAIGGAETNLNLQTHIAQTHIALIAGVFSRRAAVEGERS
jgi:hypothetical protein